MKPVPLVLLLVLLTSHLPPAAGRPSSFPGPSDGSSRFRSQLDEVLLLRAAVGDDAVSYLLLGDNILRLLQRNNNNPRLRSPNRVASLPADDDEKVATPTRRDAEALAHLARDLASLATEEEEGRARGGSEPDVLADLSKRNNDPPISIDLTFHLLRNMIEMAKIESQKEQAEINRKFLDEIGK
ncbi:urotensin 1 [Polymixia lowei]